MVEKKERLDYFDIFKFILIVSVVAGHSEIPYWLKTLIFSIHMPAFIIVNGYFMKPSGICEHMAKTGRSLIPVYFITVAALNLSQFIRHMLFDEPLIINTSLWGIVRLTAGSPLLYPMGAIWFVNALFWSRTVLNIFLKFKYPLPLVIAASFIANFSYRYIILPFSIQAGIGSVIFLYIGYIMKKYDVLNRVRKPAFAAAVSVLVWLAGGLGLPFVSVLDCQYTIPNILAAASGTFGILIILRISAPKNHMKLYSVLLFIGRNTLAVLCWHTIDDYIINVFYHKEIMAYLPVTEPVFIVLRIIFNMIPIIIIYIMEHCKIIARKGYG